MCGTDGLAGLAYVAISLSSMRITLILFFLVDVVNSLSPSPYSSHTFAKGATGTVQRAITFDTSKQKRILDIKFRSMQDTARDILTDYTRRGW